MGGTQFKTQQWSFYKEQQYLSVNCHSSQTILTIQMGSFIRRVVATALRGANQENSITVMGLNNSQKIKTTFLGSSIWSFTGISTSIKFSEFHHWQQSNT